MSVGDAAVALLQRLIQFDTVNPPGDEHLAQDFLLEQLQPAGFECELVGAVPHRPNLIARLRGLRDGPTLCLLGHVDTVLADPSEWTVDPWSGELRDDHVWGRGALDMKGIVASEVAAAVELGHSGWRPASGDLLVVATCDEEAGATFGAKWLCENVPEKVRCDLILNEGAGEVVDYGGQRYYTVCIGEKGVFRFKLTTEGRAGHASMPSMGDNALLRMVRLLSRLDGHQPELDSYEEGISCLEVLLREPVTDVASALERVHVVEPRLVHQLDPMMRVTVVPTMIRASRKENVIPSSCTVHVDCRVPPGMGEDHARQRIEALIGSQDGGAYKLEFTEHVIGNSSPLASSLMQSLREFAQRTDPGAEMLPLVLPGFTDSHWFRKAFPECVAYGFFPQRAMSLFDTGPLIHAPDERIAVEDLHLAAGFYRDLAVETLG